MLAKESYGFSPLSCNRFEVTSRVSLPIRHSDSMYVHIQHYYVAIRYSARPDSLAAEIATDQADAG